MRVSMLTSLMFGLVLSLQTEGSQFNRQLKDVGSTIAQVKLTENQNFQQTIVDLLSEKDIKAAADALNLKVQDGKTDMVVDVIVEIVNLKEKPLIKRLSDTLVALNEGSPEAYGQILSSGLADRQAIDRINAFDKLLCLQTDSNPNLCYGFQTAEDLQIQVKGAVEEYVAYEVSEDFGTVLTDPKSAVGEKLLSQLLNGDYNSAAWTVVGNAADFDKQDYSRAINSATMDGAGGAAGESMLHSLRLAARQGNDDEVSLLLAQLMVQNYRKDVIPLLGKASAFASIDGLDNGVQRMVRSAIEQGGDVRSILEVMNQIAAQGGNTGVKDMAIVVVGAESSGAQLATLVQVMAYSMCRGGVFWDSFSRIYNKAVEMNGCDSIQKSFMNGHNSAQNQCPKEVPQDLYTSSPSLQACSFTESSPTATIEQSTVITSDEIDKLNSINNQAPVFEPVATSIPTQVPASVPEAFDENQVDVQNAVNVADASPQGMVGAQSVLQRFMAQLTGKNDEVEESAPVATNTTKTTATVATVQTKSSQVADDVVAQSLCVDVVPKDNNTANCEQRQIWGGCEKDWMIAENFCAKTCGFCQEKGNTAAVTETSAVFVVPEVESKVSPPVSKPAKLPRQIKCTDTLPTDNSTATCTDRKEWGSCEKDWMVEGNYCANTCGYCGNNKATTATTTSTTATAKPAPATSLLSQIAQVTPNQATLDAQVAENVDSVGNVSPADTTTILSTSSVSQTDVTPFPVAVPAPIVPQPVPAKQNVVESSTPALAGLLAQISNRLQGNEKQVNTQSEQKRSSLSTLVEVSSSSCEDVEPVDADAANCAQRKIWGACEKTWMVDGNYCAVTCGYCKPSSQA